MNRRVQYRFRLFVAGDARNSSEAIVNLNALCRAHLAGRYEIEVVDVFRAPDRALAEGIFLTPTLVRLSPSPSLRIVGTLSQHGAVLHALGLDGAA